MVGDIEAPVDRIDFDFEELLHPCIRQLRVTQALADEV